MLAAGGLTTAWVVGVAKGLLFVAVTTVGLFLVLRRLTGQVLRVRAGSIAEQRRYAALVRRSTDIIAVVDAADDRLAFVSPSIQRVLGWTPEEVIERGAMSLIHPSDHAVARELFRGDVEEVQQAVIRALTDQGTWRLLELDLSPHDGEIGGRVINGRDVTDRISAEQALHRATQFDPLTGMPNRRQFEAAVRDMSYAAQPAGGRLVVMVLDVDDFRAVNEDVGTEGGDEVLRELAVRVGDLVPAGGTAGRLSGDSFALAFPLAVGQGAGSEVRLMADGLRRRLSAPLRVDGEDVSLSVACGAAICEVGSAPLAALVAAETALVEAKSLPDRVVIVVDQVAARTRLRQTELRDALERDELVLRYQPQWALDRRELVGFEALVRWNHPSRGLLSPAAFLDEVQSRGLQPAVTRRVLRLATTFLAELDGAAPDLRVSVNLSLDDLSRRELVGEVLEAVDRSGIDASRLRLELTERALLQRPDVSIRSMQALRTHGVTFSIDDFGTGYSSLAHLKALPVDEVKVDRSFVADLRDPRGRAIVQAVIDMSRQVDLVAVAEGIEDDATLEALLEMGCPLGQGYLLAAPLEPDAVRQLLLDQAPAAAPLGDPPG